MEENKEITLKLEKAYQQIESKLQEGVTYYSTPAVTTYGTVGGQLFTIENGERIYRDRKDDEKLDLFSVTTKFPAYTIVRYTIRKGEPITVEASSPQMLIEAMRLTMKRRTKLYDEPERIETHVKFLKKGKKIQLDMLEKTTDADGSVSEDEDSCIEDELNAFYHACEGKIKKIYVAFEKDTFVVKTSPAIPGLTSEIVEKKVKLTLDASNLEAIYAFMESHDEAKIAKALEVLKTHPDFHAKATKRYLNLVRARLNNASATLEQFPEVALLKSEVNLLLGKNFDKDFLSFSYFEEQESKLVVDFIGSMVQNAIDVEAYVAEAVQLTDKETLSELYDVYAAKAKSAILEEAKIYPEGWYAQISGHLIKLELRRVLFEKTSFNEANNSLALKAFIFFLNVHSPLSVHLDIFQSDVPELTEMFWLLKSVPDTGWGDTTLKIPDSPLKIKRSASYKIGDEGKWESISKP